MSTFDVVARHLQIEAIKRRGDLSTCDVFGRSAYNRYYYATFLLVRKMLRQFDSRWTEIPHADYPNLLKGEIKRKISDGRKRASKAGDQNLISQCQQAVAASSSLSDLMKLGSAARLIADYHPELPIVFIDNGRFKLNNIDITSAHEWPNRAEIFIETIEKVWIQINV